MSNSHELQVAELGMKIAEDFRIFIASNSKEAETRLVEALCQQPTLYERFFNKKAYELKQELIRKELNDLRAKNNHMFDKHFHFLCSNFDIMANTHLARMEAIGQSQLCEDFLKYKQKHMAQLEEDMEMTMLRFSRMRDSAERIYGNRPGELENQMNHIRRLETSAMEELEQNIKNLLRVLQKDLGVEL